jgi:hypothetical protein
VPTSQKVQTDEPDIELYVPGLQSAHALAPDIAL